MLSVQCTCIEREREKKKELTLKETILGKTQFKRALMPLSDIAMRNEMLQSFTVQNDIKALELAT